MGDITEGLGSAVEGGLLARTLERPGAEAAPLPDGRCLNCGTALEGAFCHACGQKAHIHRTITAILHDLAHGVLHLDGKLWNTLPLLAFRPGRLTRDYIDGKRARYVSPMAMFLFSVFLMFAVFQALGIATPTDLDTGSGLRSGYERTTAQLASERARQAEALAALPPGAPERSEIEQEIAGLDELLEAMKQGRDRVVANAPETELTLTGIAGIDEGLVRKWREHPELMLYKLQNNSYKFSWALIPLSVPFVWLLFLWRRRFKAYDHAIFVTYSLAFMSLLFIALSVLGASGLTGTWVFGALAVIPPVHLYKQLRHTYDLSRFSAFWRLCVLSLFIWIVLILFLQLLLVLGGI